jgi:hypothetical protein
MTDTRPRGAGHVRGAALIGATGLSRRRRRHHCRRPGRLQHRRAPAADSRETRDRARAAVMNSYLPWPGHATTVTLAPPGLPAHSAGLDLASAAGCSLRPARCPSRRQPGSC